LDPLVLLTVAAVLLEEEEPPWNTNESPPFAVLDAGANTKVLPPLLPPRNAALLPLAAVTGTLRTDPDRALPAVLITEFDWDEVPAWAVRSVPTTVAFAAVAVNTVRDPTMKTPSMPRQMFVRMCVVLLYLN
jgi:hypothetical protein